MCRLEAVLLGTVMFFATALPVMAKGPRQEVPEPNALVLLAIGFAGIVIGRRMAYRKPPRD